jgi:hypothetical protein
MMKCSLRSSIALAALALGPACFNPDAPAASTEGSTAAESSTGSTPPVVTTAADTTSEASSAPGSSGGSTSTSTSSTGSIDAGSSSSGSTSTGATACGPGEFGPDCAPCACENGSCDEGIEGTGTCVCESGWTGSACDWDCGPGGELQGDGSCHSFLIAVEDAFVCSDDWAALNFGFDDYTPRAVGQQNAFTGNQIGRAFYKFDLSVLPAGIGLTGGQFYVKQYDNFAGFPTTVQLRSSPSTWAEGNITWNNQPAVPGVGLGTADVGCCGQEHWIDVTDAVQTALDNAEDEVSFQLRGDDEAMIGGVRWFFREGDGVNLNGIIGAPPALELVYTVP